MPEVMVGGPEDEGQQRLALERAVARFRACALVFSLLQTAVAHGDSIPLNAATLTLLAITSVAAFVAVRRNPDERTVRRLGVVTMACDAVVVAALLANNLGDPHDVIYLVVVLPAIEAALRWTVAGGLIGGIAGGAGASAWTALVLHRAGVPIKSEYLTMRLGLIALLGGFVGMVIRQLHTERRRVAESEQRYKSLFEHNPDAVYSLDLGGVFVSVNTACSLLSGYAPEELVGNSVAELLPAHDRAPVAAYLARVADGMAQTFETTIRHKRGHLVHLHVTSLPIVVGGEVVGVFGVAKDVTERRLLEEALARQ